MRREGTLLIVQLNHLEEGERMFNLAFLDYASVQTTMKTKQIRGESALRAYLTTKIKMFSGAIDTVLKDLDSDGNARICNTFLSDEPAEPQPVESPSQEANRRSA